MGTGASGGDRTHLCQYRGRRDCRSRRSDSDLEPVLLERLLALRAVGTLTCDFPGCPLGLSWIFIRCWTRMYGTITLEVFRHMDLEVIASGALFRAMLENNARDLSFSDDWPRLRALTKVEMSR